MSNEELIGISPASFQNKLGFLASRFCQFDAYSSHYHARINRLEKLPKTCVFVGGGPESAYDLAFSLMEQGKKTVLVDLDAEGRLTERFTPEVTIHPSSSLSKTLMLSAETNEVWTPAVIEYSTMFYYKEHAGPESSPSKARNIAQIGHMYLVPHDLGMADFADHFALALTVRADFAELARTVAAYPYVIDHLARELEADFVFVYFGGWMRSAFEKMVFSLSDGFCINEQVSMTEQRMAMCAENIARAYNFFEQVVAKHMRSQGSSLFLQEATKRPLYYGVFFGTYELDQLYCRDDNDPFSPRISALMAVKGKLTTAIEKALVMHLDMHDLTMVFPKLQYDSLPLVNYCRQVRCGSGYCFSERSEATRIGDMQIIQFAARIREEMKPLVDAVVHFKY